MVKEGLSTNGDEENLIVVFLDVWLSGIGANDLIVVKSSHVRREWLPPVSIPDAFLLSRPVV